MAAAKSNYTGVDYDVDTTGLAEAYRDVKAVRDGLLLLPKDPTERQRDGWNKLKYFIKHHLTVQANGGEADNDGIYKTLRLAQNIGKDMSERFDAFIGRAPATFESVCAEIRAVDAKILLSGEKNLAALQENFRRRYADEDSSHVEVAKAFLEVKEFLATLEKEAGEELKQRRREKRRKEDSSRARSLLKELELV